MRYLKLSTITVLSASLALAACGSGSSTGSNSSSGTSASVNKWTWESGSNITEANGNYGIQGTAASTNTPGARNYPAAWSSKTKLWLYGGFGNDSTGAQGDLNDLWQYDTSNGQWTWVGGSSSKGAAAVYGTQGTASSSNTPGARESSRTWIDSSGNLWLFGGDSGNGLLNDLWEYKPSAGTWTWISGSNSTKAKGVYGTMGTAAASNVPGARRDALSWIANGKLWLFGGNGYDSTGAQGNLSDLWMFDPASKQWTWEAGSKFKAVLPVYGQQDVAANSNTPGGRQGMVGWTDSSGNLWLFGGSAGLNTMNDLWKYDVSAKNWTWINGSNTANSTGSYGTKGTTAASNVPSARYIAYAWSGSNGDMWLFGGMGYGSNGNYSDLNDLWRYDPKTNQWTWVNGSSSVTSTSSYGTKGTASASNQPGARDAGATWVDSNGKFWMFGGENANFKNMNDLWMYQQ